MPRSAWRAWCGRGGVCRSRKPGSPTCDMALFRISAVSQDLRIIVTGSREWSNYGLLCRTLDGLRIVHVGHGAAPGADRLAERWARSRKVDFKAYPAEWSQFGRRAGPIRNRAMFTAEHPDLVVAFKDKFGRVHGGTEDMVDVALQNHTRVLLVDNGSLRWLGGNDV